MTERDWRIFREDFSIAYKGAAMGPSSLPVRNWAEANLPDKLMRSIERLARPSSTLCPALHRGNTTRLHPHAVCLHVAAVPSACPKLHVTPVRRCTAR